ncbi:MAG TPA: LptA/OstA family protein [Longimicrobiaceae bacterium]|nr:LptA/OstA family protein [Longimicrobiaceae bacterium]
MKRLLLPLAALAMLTASPALGQAGSCNVIESRLAQREILNGAPVIRLEGPFLIRCEGGAEIRALDGTLHELTNVVELVGNVFFQDPDRTLTADSATYSSRTGRLYAEGNVVFTNRAEGSTLRGPELEYYRATDERPLSRVLATRRPHLTIAAESDSAGAEPLELDGDRVTIVGDDDLTAIGDVVIVQAEIRATSDEARYNGMTEQLDLQGDATVMGEEFELAGQSIQVDIANGSLEKVHAETDAVLTGDDLEVAAPDLQLFFAADSLQRLVAQGGDGEDAGRAIAVAEAFRLEADSIDALLPGQALEQVIAIGNARGEALDTIAPKPVVIAADSVASSPAAVPPVLANDWVVGDTIIGFFGLADVATLAPGDTAQTELRKLVASGSAQALYRTQEESSDEAGPPGVNYLSGQIIELNFEEGELRLATVTSLRQGLYLEPIPPAPADSAPAVPGGDVGTEGRSR